MTSIGAPLLPGAPAPASRHPNDDRGVQCAGISCRFWPEGFSRLPGTRPGPETTSARFDDASVFPGFWSCPIGRCSPCQRSRLLARPIGGDRRPRALTVWAIRAGQSASRAMGDCDSACRLTAATRNFTDKDQRPCSIGNDQMWLRRVATLPFPGSHGRIGPYDRGYRLGSPWAGIMASDGRSVAM